MLRRLRLTLALAAFEEFDELVGAELDVDQPQPPIRPVDAKRLPEAEHPFVEGEAPGYVAHAERDVVEPHRPDTRRLALRTHGVPIMPAGNL